MPHLPFSMVQLIRWTDAWYSSCAGAGHNGVAYLRTAASWKPWSRVMQCLATGASSLRCWQFLLKNSVAMSTTYDLGEAAGDTTTPARCVLLTTL